MFIYNFIINRLNRGAKGQGFLNFAWWVSVVSVCLGVFALIISTSVLDGFERTLKTNAFRFTSHIRVLKFKRDRIEEPQKIIQTLRQNINLIDDAYPVVEFESLLRHKKQIEGVIVKSYAGNTFNPEIKRLFDEQKLSFTSADANEIWISKMLASKMNLGRGDTIVLATITKRGELRTSELNYTKLCVKGLYETGMAKYDETIVFVPIQTCGKLLGEPELNANCIEIFVKDITKVNEISNQIENLLSYPYFCFTFYELHSSIFAWIELQKEPIPLVLSLITIVAVFNIITFLLINIVEKTSTIGILMALGMKRSAIIRLFVFYGLKVVSAGAISGIVAALTFSILQKQYKIIHLDSYVYFLDSLPVEIRLTNYLIVLAFAFGFGLLASTVPAYIASKITPVKALRIIK